MNCAVGTRWWSGGQGTGAQSPPDGQPGAPVGGGWLSGDVCFIMTPLHTYGKISQITRPSPSNLWVIMDENPDTINDPLMAGDMIPGGNSSTSLPGIMLAQPAFLSPMVTRKCTNGWTRASTGYYYSSPRHIYWHNDFNYDQACSSLPSLFRLGQQVPDFSCARMTLFTGLVHLPPA